MEKHEFMSPAWIDMARQTIMGSLRGKDLGGVRYTLCEEFTHPPEHLCRPGAETIGFFIRVADDCVEVGDHPVPEADLKVVSEYSDALLVARDPDAAATDPAEVQERIATGRLKIVGDPSGVPRVLAELDVHRLLAPHTA